ncbi:PhoH family protein [Yanghanlia caeni]|uniref:PhoH family protein n=1 Tax=Yanghanlia caeni TaxID=3064283 RepID=A0ABU1D687_9BURK|nr:PhoH family protein [Alcaligenaceae bacterium LG-2]
MPLPKLPVRMGDRVDPKDPGYLPLEDTLGALEAEPVAVRPAATTARAAKAAKKAAARSSAAQSTAATAAPPGTPESAAQRPAARPEDKRAAAAPDEAIAAPQPTHTHADGELVAPASEILVEEVPPAPVAKQARDTAQADDATEKAQPRAAARKRARLPASRRKLFVLDTNVLLHDSNSLFKFEEHDIYLPMIVLEELDHHKKGMSEVARNARQVSRFLDALVNEVSDLEKGVNLDALGNQEALGQLLLQTTALDTALPVELPMGKADHVILGVVQALKTLHPRRTVVLVSKDINIRLKARALGMHAEDYLNDRVIDDSDLLYDGVMPLPENFWLKHGKGVESWQQSGTTFYRIKGPLCSEFLVNQFVYLEGDMPLYAQVREVSGKSAVLATLRDHSHSRNSVWGITARNREQNFALNLLMNPDIDFVSLLGQAGTGKTLLALAAGLAHTLETNRYNEIIITRATVPVGDDIGFLPGTEEEKMLPWMGALEDNLEVLHLGAGRHDLASDTGGTDWNRQSTMELIRSRIKVKSLNFMRGRTFLNKYLIIDEAQNLTPKQMKTLVTRAGPGTKIICLGNIAQIDTPYLTEGSSGLTYVVDRFKGWPHAGHVTLQRGERSRLADYASEAL